MDWLDIILAVTLIITFFYVVSIDPIRRKKQNLQMSEEWSEEWLEDNGKKRD